MKRGVTLVECLVVVAILATLVGVLAPHILGARSRDKHGDPPETVQMVTVQHDDHWWILCRDSFLHHPDCPCRRRTAEANLSSR